MREFMKTILKHFIQSCHIYLGVFPILIRNFGKTIH